MAKNNMSIENGTERIIFATAKKPYKPDVELHISLSTWCVYCYRDSQTYEPASFIFGGNSLCEECCLDASVGDEPSV